MAILERTFGKENFQARYYVEETQHGMRLDQFVQIYLSSFSRQSIIQKIKNGEVLIDQGLGKVPRPRPRPSTKLHYKEIIIVQIPKTEHEDEFWQGEKLPLLPSVPLAFEHEDFVACSKPPFMSTHPTGKHLFYCATVYLEQERGHRFHSVHRLDRETSGLLLLAKNPKAANALTVLFDQGSIQKAYLFMAHDHQPTSVNNFTVNLRLGTTEKGLKRVLINAYPPSSTEGKSALTYFHVFHRSNGHALGLAFPKTGRQHQIRVHAAQSGLPLVGDKIYYGGYPLFQRFKDGIATDEDHELMQLPRHALHATALRFNYQTETFLLKDTLPLDFVSWCEKNLDIDTKLLEQRVSHALEEFFADWP